MVSSHLLCFNSGSNGCSLYRYWKCLGSTSWGKKRRIGIEMKGEAAWRATDLACVLLPILLYWLLLREQLVDSVNRMCQSVIRVLRSGGLFIQISFEQPHFRQKFLNVRSVWPPKITRTHTHIYDLLPNALYQKQTHIYISGFVCLCTTGQPLS